MDWGLGHASRSTKLIQILNSMGHEVLIASSGPALELLKQEFPKHSFFNLPGYQPAYSQKKIFLVFSLILRIPHFLKIISNEHQYIQNLVRRENISVIFSDNRYGCYSKSAYSIFIGHQLTIPVGGWLRPFRFSAAQAQALWLKKFNEIWVPDQKDRFFSGLMGKAFGLSPRYIGILSRFVPCEDNSVKKIWITAIVSGPEPYRKQLVDLLENLLVQLDKPCCLLTGQPHQPAEFIVRENLTVINHLAAADLQKVICESELIISRSGYSSVLDYATTGSKVILIPTPGQPEQEYLARRLNDIGSAVSIRQADLSLITLKAAITKVKKPAPKNAQQDLVSALQSINFASS